MNSLFIVIEGLDGSGKSTAAKGLAAVLENEHGCTVKHTYEPNNPCAAGQYIRDVLGKKITRFHPRVLGLAYATNRLDHCSRVINPWLEGDGKKRIVVSDRYYLSSLVYQSDEDFSFEDVMRLNENARKPDLIIFMNVSEEVCHQRLDKRNQPRELFEENFAQNKNKFFQGIDFLRNIKKERIVEVDGSVSKEEVVGQMVEKIKTNFPAFFS